MKKKVLISTGGSGGHVIPATILYDHLSGTNEVIISTDKRGLRYLDGNSYEIKIIDGIDFKADKYFDISVNSWKLDNLVPSVLAAHKLCKQLNDMES